MSLRECTQGSSKQASLQRALFYLAGKLVQGPSLLACLLPSFLPFRRRQSSEEARNRQAIARSLGRTDARESDLKMHSAAPLAETHFVKPGGGHSCSSSPCRRDRVHVMLPRYPFSFAPLARQATGPFVTLTLGTFASRWQIALHAPSVYPGFARSAACVPARPQTPYRSRSCWPKTTAKANLCVYFPVNDRPAGLIRRRPFVGEPFSTGERSRDCVRGRGAFVLLERIVSRLVREWTRRHLFRRCFSRDI